MSSKIALLIDAENVSHRDLPRIIQEVSRFGRIVLQAVYADWHKPDLQTWLTIAQENDFRIRHQTSAATKNSTDMKLMMDAMEILYRTSVEVFCLVSNDADYVPLCHKIHEAKKYVIGIGYQQAAETFIRACNQFIFIETPVQRPLQPVVKAPTSLPAQLTTPKTGNHAELRTLLTKAFAKAPHNNRWVTLSALGSALRELKASFRPNDYGHATLSKLLQNMPDFVELQINHDVKSARLKNVAALQHATDLQKLLSEAFAKAPQESDRWVSLSALGTALREVQASFRPNNYGHATLSKLLQTMPDFVEVRTKGTVKSARLKI